MFSKTLLTLDTTSLTVAHAEFYLEFQIIFRSNNSDESI